MSELAQLQKLMSEIGPVMELIGVAEYGDGDAWALIFDDDMEVWAELDSDAGSLILTAEVGVPNEDGRAELYETLLLYNHQRAETGGVRMALAEPGGPIVQSFELNTTDLVLPKVVQVLEGFVDINRGWRKIVSINLETSDGESKSTRNDEIQGLPPDGGIRV